MVWEQYNLKINVTLIFMNFETYNILFRLLRYHNQPLHHTSFLYEYTFCPPHNGNGVRDNKDNKVHQRNLDNPQLRHIPVFLGHVKWFCQSSSGFSLGHTNFALTLPPLEDKLEPQRRLPPWSKNQTLLWSSLRKTFLWWILKTKTALKVESIVKTNRLKK